jgi:hypothetical protein
MDHESKPQFHLISSRNCDVLVGKKPRFFNDNAPAIEGAFRAGKTWFVPLDAWIAHWRAATRIASAPTDDAYTRAVAGAGRRGAR